MDDTVTETMFIAKQKATVNINIGTEYFHTVSAGNTLVALNMLKTHLSINVFIILTSADSNTV